MFVFEILTMFCESYNKKISRIHFISKPCLKIKKNSGTCAIKYSLYGTRLNS